MPTRYRFLYVRGNTLKGFRGFFYFQHALEEMIAVHLETNAMMGRVTATPGTIANQEFVVKIIVTKAVILLLIPRMIAA